MAAGWEQEYLDRNDQASGRPADLPAGSVWPLPFRNAGRDVTLWPLAKIVRAGMIDVGDHVIIDDFVFLDGGLGTRIGRNVHIAVGAVICGGGHLEVGDFSNIASGARVYTGTDDVIGHLVGPTVPAPYRSADRMRTVFGRHVQVLANAVIHAGVRIPDGTIVAPGAVVRREDVRAWGSWGVYGGQPARFLKDRYKPRQVIELEKKYMESQP